MTKKLLGLCSVFLLSLLSVFVFFNDGYFPMHDDTQVGRVVVMGKALELGQFPVRWVSELGYGYGYPLFNFYGPLPYYFGGLLYVVGLSSLVATKVMMMLGMVLAGVTMFLLVSSLLGIAAGLVSSIMYTYAPYHAVQLYVRGAIGELWAYAFFPLIALGVFKNNFLLLAFGIFGVVTSHTLMGYVVVLGMVLVCLITRKHVLGFLVGLGFSAFFWFPAIFEMRFTNVSQQIGETANFFDHFVCLPQLWSSQWGFGGSAKGCVDGMSFMVGKLHIAAVAVSLLLWIYNKKIFFNKRNIFFSSIAVFLLGIFFLLPASSFLWKLIPGFDYLQYPWRFLVFAVFGSSILSGFLVYSQKSVLQRLVSCSILISAAIVFYGKWFTPQYLYSQSSAEFESIKELRWRVSSVSDEYLPSEVIRPTKEEEVPRDTIASTGIVVVKHKQETDIYSKFEIEASHKQEVQINRAFFPGLTVHVNGRRESLLVKGGLPVVELPEGKSIVEVRFVDTPVRIFANIMSMMSLTLALYIYGKKTHA